MATPDVRVRLSAEGLGEVVSALRKVQTEAGAAAAKSRKGFLSLNGVLGATKSLLAQLGAAVSLGALANVVKQGADLAETFGAAAQRVGTTTQRIAQLAIVAETAETDISTLQQGLVRFARSLDELRSGSPELAAAFRRIGLSARDFNGLDVAQAFELVASRMGTLQDSAGKTAVALQVFGRGGAALIPTMNALARGVDPLAAKIAGAFSPDVIAATDALNDTLTLLNRQAQGFAANFAAGIAPSVVQVMRDLGVEVADNASAFKRLGEEAGVIFKVTAAFAVTVLALIAGTFANIRIQAVGLWEAANLAMRGHLTEAAARLELLAKQVATIHHSVGKQIFNQFTAIRKEPSKLEGTPGGTLEVEERESQRRAVLEAELDAELKLTEAHLKAQTSAQKNAFEAGLTDVRSYYAARRAIVRQETDAEIATLLKRRLSETDPNKRRTIDLQIQRVRVDATREETDLTADETQAVRRLTDERVKGQQRAMEAQGQRHAAAMLAIDEEEENLRISLAQAGFKGPALDTAVAEIVGPLRDAENATVQLNDVNRELNALALERQSIEQKVANGRVGELAGRRQILEIEKARVPQLRAMAGAALQAAEASKDPEAILNALELLAALDRVAVAADIAGQRMAKFASDARGAVQGSLSGSLREVGREIQTLGDFVSSFLQQLVQGIQNIASELISIEITEAIFGSLPGFKGGGRVERRASGGYISGPGGPTADRIPALLSAGEYVVRASAVGKPENRRILERMNRGVRITAADIGAMERAMRPLSIVMPNDYRPLQLAGGGLVGDAAPAAAAGAFHGQMTVGLEDGLVERRTEAFMGSSNGQALIIRAIAKQPRTARRALGLG